MKFLGATSRHTDNSIFACQNERFLLECQLAQRNEYSHAKKASRLKSIMTLAFTTLSVVASILDVDTLSAISSLFAVGLVVFNKYSDEHISSHKNSVKEDTLILVKSVTSVMNVVEEVVER